MAFNKKLYEESKKLTLWNLENIPLQYSGSIKDWILSFLYSAGEYIKKEQYEQAKGIKDAVTEYINKYLPENENIDINTVIKEKYSHKK